MTRLFHSIGYALLTLAAIIIFFAVVCVWVMFLNVINYHYPNYGTVVVFGSITFIILTLFFYFNGEP